MPLTDTAIRNAKPGPKPQRLFDGGGLYLEVAPSGGKWWRFKYRFGGKEKRFSLGVYPDVSLKDAREKRIEARKLLAAGVDPAAARKSEKAEQQADAETFELVARQWHEKFTPTWTPGHAARIMTALEKDAFPWIGSKPIRELTPPEVLAVARRVESRGALETAHRLVGMIGMACRYAVACGMAESDPTASLKGALPPSSVQHHASITRPEEVGQLLRAIEGYSGSFTVQSALRFLPHVFVRPGELRFAEWSEFDLEDDSPLWTIPAERMKMRDKHIIPLSRQTLGILKELRPLTGSGSYVFPSERTQTRPISANTLNAALRRMGYAKDQMTAHGFRSLASTTLNELGWPADAIERQLAHAERNKVRASYNFAQHIAKRREMMQAWSDFLDRLRDEKKVVPLFRAASE